MRKQILALLFLFPAAAMAQQQWTIIDQRGNTFALDSVTCLLASDTEEAFTIVLKNGSLQTGVTEASFKKQDLTAISSPTARKAQLPMAIVARTSLTLSGCAEGTAIRLYTTDGKLLRSTTAEASATTIDVASLTGGVYIIKVGDTAIKFTKK